ncbi:helix-turn-helix transcriptional regulator [Martelella lutilitoris]|uniref:Helix-turn-helix transcriptional regulator n=1 Tax=Martelella lutilitoris TaxID=2583532 RepID=A0A7T7KMW6_9HYPH|nr:AraC family transcriptional regulator [Martelella lutilitoris]QQM32222.1 helix-turn-helix transcriptional regulator [Martelella lutilitoris]
MLTSRDPANKTARLVIDQFRCVSDPEASGFETVLPSGRCQIIFSLAGRSLLDGASNGRPLAVFQGPSTTARQIPRRPQQSACGISFRPGGAGALFRRIDGFADQVVDLTGLLGKRAESLREELRELGPHAARLERLESTIVSLVEDTRSLELISRGLEDLRAGRTVREVSHELGLSSHSFRKLFLVNVGLTPKTYLGIERFRSALARMTEASSLSDLALDARYSDQSHMTREVTRFASMSPGRLRASERPYPGHVRPR